MAIYSRYGKLGDGRQVHPNLRDLFALRLEENHEIRLPHPVSNFQLPTGRRIAATLCETEFLPRISLNVGLARRHLIPQIPWQCANLVRLVKHHKSR
jgi:hypothetical protein